MNTFQELIFKIQIETIITEREAMKIKNLSREQQGLAIAYDENSFMILVKELAFIEEAIRNV